MNDFSELLLLMADTLEAVAKKRISLKQAQELCNVIRAGYKEGFLQGASEAIRDLARKHDPSKH